MPIKDITGSTFGKLTALYVDTNNTDKNHTKWICRCDCENETHKSVYLFDLTSGKANSCGCVKTYKKSNPQFFSKSPYKWERSRVYNIWDGMVQRCTNKSNKRFADYGGRGITVCDEWKHSANFIQWANSNGYEKTLTIDRIDNAKGYCPENCRWATNKEQSSNKRNTKHVVYYGEDYVLLDLLDSLNKKEDYRTIISRINELKWSVEDAIDVPKHTSKDMYYFLLNIKNEFKDKATGYKITKKDFKNKYGISTQFFKHAMGVKEVVDLVNELHIQNNFFNITTI